LGNTGDTTITVTTGTVNPTTAYANGGFIYAVSNKVTVSLTSLTFTSPKATNNRGGTLYLSSITLTLITLNSITINTGYAGQSGGVVYVTGNNVELNSNILNVNTATANSGDGGVFHFANSGTNKIVLTSPNFQTVYASVNGGIASLGGTVTDISMTTF
jgi:hypothetical protein